MNPALLKLISLQTRGFFRRSLKGSGSGTRILFFIVGAVLIVGWLSASLFNVMVARQRSDPLEVRMTAPLVLLGICLMTIVTSAGDKAIAFTRGEVDQLFPGPFSRRELLAYKLLKSTLLALLTGLILSLAMLRHAQWWLACFIGVYLSLMFVQFFSIAIVMVGQTVGAIAYSRLRKLVIGIAIVALLVAGQGWLSRSAGNFNFEQFAQQVHGSTIGGALLAPLQPFGNAITANGFPELLKWSVYSLFLVGVLVALVIVLDANYLEAAVAASQRRYDKIQKIRGGSFLSGIGVGKKARWQLPPFPFTGGAGPIAWRQITNAMRSSFGLILLLIMIGLVVASLLRVTPHTGKSVIRGALILGGYLTFLLSGMLNFDFRGDVDQMDVLKALPINSIALTLGQLAAPVMVMTTLHVLAFAGLWFVIGPQKQTLLAAAPLIVPFNLLVFCSENLIFLLFPHRPAAASPGDLQVLGRKFIFLLMKGLVLMVGLCVAGSIGVTAWILTAKSTAALICASWIALAIEGAALVPAIAWAYRKFDPSTDTPA